MMGAMDEFLLATTCFLMVTVVVMLTLIPDVCVSKQKISLLYIGLTIKNKSYYVRNAGLLTFLFHLIYVCSKET